MTRISILTIILVMFLYSFYQVSYSNTDESDIIHLSKVSSLPTQDASDIKPIRIAVAAIISPQGTTESYQPLLDYISVELDRPVELLQRNNYMEINELIRLGHVDIGFICTSAYVVGNEEFGLETLVAPEINGSSTYNSILIVPLESQAQSIGDLEGTIFAFTDPLSTTGWLYPSYLVNQLGSTPEIFFSRTFYTYSHDKAIEAVASGIADGAAVDSIVYAYWLERHPELRNKTKIIYTSPSFASPPVVINPQTRPKFQSEIEHLLLNLHATPEGQALLVNLGVDRFVPIGNEAYDNIRDIRQELPFIGES